MSTRTPIDPSEIRQGDRVRNEWCDGTAYEFIAKFDGDNLGAWPSENGGKIALSGASAHYLIDRPKPPVELPTVPTLGWVCTEDGVRAIGVWNTYTHRYKLSDQETDYLINPEREFVTEDVTAFTAATAVPTEALDELRKYRDALVTGPATPAVRRIDKFLAAVDSANEVTP